VIKNDTLLEVLLDLQRAVGEVNESTLRLEMRIGEKMESLDERITNLELLHAKQERKTTRMRALMSQALIPLLGGLSLVALTSVLFPAKSNMEKRPNVQEAKVTDQREGKSFCAQH
jgi:hypothetical protein